MDSHLDPSGVEAAALRQEARAARQADQAIDSELAAAIKALLAAGRADEARERFSVLVGHQQRRASRLAYYFLRDPAEADEAVQEAFIRVFTRLSTYQERFPFDVWFNRILINGCLDRRKAQRRRLRWQVPADPVAGSDQRRTQAVSPAPSPEDLLVARERQAAVRRAIDRLPDRQRTVVSLCLLDERSPREVSAITGMNQSTVRVHLFRALRRLRALLGGNT